MSNPQYTTLARIKALTSGNATIQALTGAELIVSMILEEVANQATLAVFGTSFVTTAQDYLAAHYLTLALGSSQGTGQTTSESVGGVSVSMQAAWAQAKSALGSTVYGQRYQELIRCSVVPMRMVRPRGVIW